MLLRGYQLNFICSHDSLLINLKEKKKLMSNLFLFSLIVEQVT